MTHTAESLQAAFKYLFVNEVPALKLLANMLPDDPVVVNLGAGAGTSGLAFMESREDLILYTIDKVGGSHPYGCLQAEEDVLKSADLWSDRVKHILGDNYLAGMCWFDVEQFDKNGHSLWPSPHADLVFIDGDHSYEGCSGDIQAWLPNIKPGGIIAVHDYRKSELYEHDEDFKDDAPHPKPWPGVDKAVDELLVPHYEQILRVDSLVALRV